MEQELLKIGICEDDDAQRRNLKRLVEIWGKDKDFKLHFSLFESCEACWFYWSDRMDLDVLLLDIDLGNEGISGIELAKRIRKKDERVKIIFITALSEYMNQGYDVEAFHFLVKPVEEELLYRVLDRAINSVERKERFLLVEGESGTQLLPIRQILYIEAFSHSSAIYLYEDGQVTRTEVRMGMKEIERLLPSDGFFRGHRSYLIGLQHVRKLEKCQVSLHGNISLPISRTREKAFYNAFLEYHKKTGDVFSN